MNQSIEILIAIQARTNSTRFPRKIYQDVGNRRVLDHVIDRANSAAKHIMRFSAGRDIHCTVAVLHPSDDHDLVSSFKASNCVFFGGPEQDVLQRYIDAQKATNADYVVRLTSDCPLLLDFVIVKCINSATFKSYDYFSNVESVCRSAADGFDCEVLSRRALDWLSENAKTPEDREHVTTAIRKLRPMSLLQGFLSFKHDTSEMKMSLDTPEDLERIREYYHRRQHKTELAEKLFGKANVHEL